MSFTSFAFIIFMLVTAMLYFIIPTKYRWIVLLCSSYVFFIWCSTWLLLVHIAATVITYVVGRLINREIVGFNQEIEKKKDELTKVQIRERKLANKKKTRSILTVGILLDLSFLLFLKYYNFFAGSFRRVTGVSENTIPYLHLLMPIGISFYTLQAISYMTDVHREKCKADDNIFHFMLYMSYFPQIVQGPIARHSHLAHQFFEEHKFDKDRCLKGIQLILWGFIKKLVLADRLAIPVNELFGNVTGYKGSILFLAAALYGIQVYADFSSGMDIARGFSEIIGIDLSLNFEQPYFAKSIEEFWRRWHITLGTWMRDYVFYPLSLSKSFGELGKKMRKYIGISAGNKFPSFLAMFIVYLLVGFWHGANWTYIVYGVWNGVFIASGILLTDTYAGLRNKCHISDSAIAWKLFQIVRTFIICSFGRIFSRAESIGHAFYMFASIFRDWTKSSIFNQETLCGLGLDMPGWILVLVAVIFILAIDFLHEKGIHIRDTIAKQNIVIRWIIYYAAIFIVIIYGVYGAGYDSSSFIYAQF